MKSAAKWMLCALALVCAFGLGRGNNSYNDTDLARAREDAYNSGYHTGYDEGAAAGQEALYQQAFEEGRTAGYEQGFSEGSARGAAAREEAVLSAVGDTYIQGYDAGYAEGYAQKDKDTQSAREQYLASLQPILPSILPSVSPQPEDRDAAARTGQSEDTVQTGQVDSEDAETIVYVTASGSKYHTDGCRHLSKSKIEKTLAEAKALALAPCKVCSPPQ